MVDASRWKRTLIAGPVALITGAALLTLLSPDPAAVWIGQLGAAVIGAAVGTALAGLALGLGGERLFAGQAARNEFWRHGGNFASLFAAYLAVPVFGQRGVVWLMIATAFGALGALAAIDPARIDQDVARGLRP